MSDNIVLTEVLVDGVMVEVSAFLVTAPETVVMTPMIIGPVGPMGPPGPQGPPGQIVALAFADWPPVAPIPGVLYLRLAP